MHTARPICLLSDFGTRGPYVGLMHWAVRAVAPQAMLLDIQHDLPRFMPVQSGLLLAALLAWLPASAVVVAVVDPGVGGAREGLIVEVGGRTLVGPDNGLFATLLRQASSIGRIEWRPEVMSASFHGRDWFCPVAAQLALGSRVSSRSIRRVDCECPAIDLAQVIYVDGFGNLMTGLPGTVSRRCLRLAGYEIPCVRTFGEVRPGELLCYSNSLGLLEIAVNQGSAAEVLGLAVGDTLPVAAI